VEKNRDEIGEENSVIVIPLQLHVCTYHVQVLLSVFKRQNMKENLGLGKVLRCSG
jgi:hypothetical protein